MGGVWRHEKSGNAHSVTRGCWAGRQRRPPGPQGTGPWQADPRSAPASNPMGRRVRRHTGHVVASMDVHGRCKNQQVQGGGAGMQACIGGTLGIQMSGSWIPDINETSADHKHHFEKQFWHFAALGWPWEGLWDGSGGSMGGWDGLSSKTSTTPQRNAIFPLIC